MFGLADNLLIGMAASHIGVPGFMYQLYYHFWLSVHAETVGDSWSDCVPDS